MRTAQRSMVGPAGGRPGSGAAPGATRPPEGQRWRRLAAAVAFAALAAAGAVAAGAEDAPHEIKLENGRFSPQQVVVPAGTPLQLRVTNADKAAIEFESFELHRERVVQPGETITVFLPALAPGSYPFFDDFHRDTAEGAIVAQ